MYLYSIYRLLELPELPHLKRIRFAISLHYEVYHLSANFNGNVEGAIEADPTTMALEVGWQVSR